MSKNRRGLVIKATIVVAGSSVALGAHSQNEIAAVKPLIFGGGAVFLLFAMFSSTTEDLMTRVLCMTASLLGLCALVAGFGIMFTH